MPSGLLRRSTASAVISLIDPDLTTRWISASADWVIDTDPDGRMGRESMERVHLDDIPKLLQGLAQLRATAREGGSDPPVIEPLRYRKRRRDGTWIAMEAMVQNLLSDPIVNGLVIISDPPAGCSTTSATWSTCWWRRRRCPTCWPPAPASCRTTSARPRWWASVDGRLGGRRGRGVAGRSAGGGRALVADPGRRRARTLSDFAGFAELAAEARARGFVSAWVPLPEASSGRCSAA